MGHIILLSTSKPLLMSLIICLTNVGPNLAKNIPAVNNAASIYDYMDQQNLNSMFTNPVNEAEVIRIIKLCRLNDSMDYDDISMWVLSRIAPHVVKPLGHIFKLSFSTDIFPSEMKIAKVIPLFKNGNKYRTSLTIVQFHFYHSSLRYWKNYSTSDYNNS